MSRAARLGGLWPLVCLLAAWHLAAVNQWLGNAFVVPPPADVAGRAVALWQAGTLQRQALVTTGRVLAAFALALLVGGTAGLLMGRVATVARRCGRWWRSGSPSSRSPRSPPW